MWPFDRYTERSVEENPDGSRTVTTSFQLSGATRRVDHNAIAAFDAALTGLGGEVVHAFDPARVVRFEEGGPPIWSVGIVNVPDPIPYTLLVTYGLSRALSSEDGRRGTFEYSLAVPAAVQYGPWADALLRHLSRYVLSGNELKVGDVMPCNAPITFLPFQAQDHASKPETSLVGIITTTDPVLPRIATPAGDVEIRRFVGLDQDELDRIETWSAAGFLEEYEKRDPLLLTDIDRATSLADPSFRAQVDERAEREGSSAPAILLDVTWADTGDELVIDFPGGREARMLLRALYGRIPFGKSLNVVSRTSPPIVFRPADRFAMNWSPDALTIDGGLEDASVADIVSVIRPNGRGQRLRFPLED